MKMDEVIARINELAAKNKTVGLTPEETEERAKLRRIYINSVKQNLVGQLENTYIDTPEMVEEAIKTMELILRNTDDKAVIDFGKILLEMLQIAKENNTIVGFLF